MSSRYTGERTGLELWAGMVSGPELVRDYIAGADALAPFFAGSPFDPEAYRRKADAVHARLKPADRARIQDAMIATRPSAAAKMQRVLRGEGLAVTTGQQAGLFGGPLYTVHKILSAIRLAAELEALLDQPVVPVFWIAADDHDWAEVNHTFVIDAQNEVRRIELSDGDVPPVPMSERRLGAQIGDALAALAAAMPGPDLAGPVLEMVRAAYTPGRTMAGAFADLLRRMFAAFDLILVDPSHESMKQAAVPLLLADLERTVRGDGLLLAQADRLVRAGYHVQVTIAPEAANVFLSDEAGRDRLTRDNGGWLLRRTKRSLSDGELRTLLERDPARFSPNVLLRPVVESALIPTVAYVGGPSEIGYFAQIGCLFHAHGVEPPLVVPRHSVIIVESKVRKVLDKFRLEPAAAMLPFHELSTRVIREDLPAAVQESLARLREDTQARWDALGQAVAAVDPTLQGMIERTRNQALSQIDSIAKKITSHQKKRSEVELEQLRKAATHLYPAGQPQERVLNVLPFLGRYGTALLQDVAGVIRPRIDQARPDWAGVVCSPAD